MSSPTSSFRRGFTLLELLVSVTITVVILAIIVGIISTTSRSWREGRAKLETNQTAREALAVLSSDLQSALIRIGVPANDSPDPPNQTWASWLEVRDTIDAASVGVSTGNSQELYFFSPIADLETAVDDPVDATGTLAGVRYTLVYQDPITVNNADDGDMQLFGLYRDVRPPSEVYGTGSDGPLLGESDLEAAFGTDVPDQDELVAANVVDFTLSFEIENGDGEVVVAPPGESFTVNSNGILSDLTGLTGDLGVGARLLAVQINLTIIDERGAELLRQLDSATGDIGSQFANQNEFLQEHGNFYSQRVKILSN